MNFTKQQDLANLGTEFLYDANDNMIADYDREIVSIRFNLLNLSDTIQFKNGNQIINRYAADGSKLRTDYFTLVTPLTVPITAGKVNKLGYEVDVINQDTRMFADNFEYTLWKDPDMDAISLSRINNSEGYAHFGLNPKVSYYYYRKGHWIQYDNGMLTKVYNGSWGEHWSKRTRQQWWNAVTKRINK